MSFRVFESKGIRNVVDEVSVMSTDGVEADHKSSKNGVGLRVSILANGHVFVVPR